MTEARIPIAVRAESGRLVPVDAASQEQIMTGLRRGVVYHVVPTVPEGDLEEHRRALNFYMAGIGLLFENIDDTGPGRKFPTVTHLRKHFLRALGFAEPVYRADKSYKMEPESMALDAMSLEVLRQFTDQSRAYAEEIWGIEPWQLWEDEHKIEGQK